MPVSRGRKPKPKSKSKQSRRPPSSGGTHGGPSIRILQPPPPVARPRPAAGNALDLLARFTAERAGLNERRQAVATASAEAIVRDLLECAASSSAEELEDQLCVLLGRHLYDVDDVGPEDHVSPALLATTLASTGGEAARAALSSSPQAEGVPAAWRVLTSVAAILPDHLSDRAVEAIDDLLREPHGHLLPSTVPGPSTSGPAFWVRDAYGSRFAVTAKFSSPECPDRWYLWDVDACVYEPVTVFSGYYGSADEALAAWRSGVGSVAVDGAVFTEVDDPQLLAELLPYEQGQIRMGGESRDQFAEYLRSRRLSEVLRSALARESPTTPATLDAAGAVREFSAWLETNRPSLWQAADPVSQLRKPVPAPDQQPDRLDELDAPVDESDEEPPRLDELIVELADSWHGDGPAALYATCSPHRVALTVAHLSSYYMADFAQALIGLLPSWTDWLAERNGTPPHLAERCRPYALGAIHPDVAADESTYLNRATE